LLCDKCGAAAPTQVDAPEEAERETAPVVSTEAALTVVQEPGSAKTEAAEDSEIVQVEGACGVCSTQIDAMIMPFWLLMEHLQWGADTGGFVCPACGVLYCDSCKKQLGFSRWGDGKNAHCRSCGANIMIASPDGKLQLFTLADNWVRTIQKKLADPNLDAKLARIKRERAKQERQKTN
jgi:hypothetical protein